MTKPIHIFRHIAHEGPGYLGLFLNRQNIPFEIIEVDQGAPIPQTPDNSAGLVFMGGPMSVNDPLPWIEPELALIRQAVACKMPVLGHCLGGQLISKALGGSISSNHTKEIGWLDVERLDNATARSWLTDLPQRFAAFHWHGETFSIPAGASHILKSDHCRHQAFAFDNVLAMQCHIEMTAELVPLWADCNAQEIAQPSATVQSKTTMTQNLEQRVAALQKVADQLYSRWLQGLAR
ncbi:MAG TPA: type 1 glutamine amidotransferase [Candidatus Tenderia sp.]|nr:type 1 glutamine amidotransferase [Candidatus Tenderia sp.]